MMTPLHITGMKELAQENSINASFDSIERIILQWRPEITQQNYSIFAYQGLLVKGQKIPALDLPFERTPIFTNYAQTSYYVGDLDMNGILTVATDKFKDTPTTIFQLYPSIRSDI